MQASIGFSIPITQLFDGAIVWRGLIYSCLMTLGKFACGFWLVRLTVQDGISPNTTRRTSQPKEKTTMARPKSLYPASILGCAMIARGEVGFLISAVAQTNGILSADVFLLVTWAILLCTIIGPVAVGLLARRVHRLQQTERAQASGKEDPLGDWGVCIKVPLRSMQP